jgi:hypothetical protein
VDTERSVACDHHWVGEGFFRSPTGPRGFGRQVLNDVLPGQRCERLAQHLHVVHDQLGAPNRRADSLMDADKTAAYLASF